MINIMKMAWKSFVNITVTIQLFYKRYLKGKQSELKIS